ncbi:MAG: hypothetical protein ABFD75_11495 [Smithella sp.]
MASFTLYLSPWQVRLAKDFLPRVVKKFSKIKIEPGVITCPASYKIPVDGLSKRDWVLYLTDEQIAIVQEKFNLKTKISGINITEALIKSKAVAFM